MEATAEDVMEMPKYRCHKEVWALRIGAVSQGDGPDTVLLSFSEPEYAPLIVSVLKRPTPHPGWYYVVYDSPTNPGYHSFSPAREFEDGYALIER
jgi:hypothetical protein